MEVRATRTGFGVHVEFSLHGRQQLSRWTPAAKTLEELVGRFDSRLSRPSNTLFFRQRQRMGNALSGSGRPRQWEHGRQSPVTELAVVNTMQRQINHHRALIAVDFARCQACRSPVDARSGEPLHRALPNAYLVLIHPVEIRQQFLPIVEEPDFGGKLAALKERPRVSMWMS